MKNKIFEVGKIYYPQGAERTGIGYRCVKRIEPLIGFDFSDTEIMKEVLYVQAWSTVLKDEDGNEYFVPKYPGPIVTSAQ